MIRSGGRLETFGATGPVATTADRLQHELGGYPTVADAGQSGAAFGPIR